MKGTTAGLFAQIVLALLIAFGAGGCGQSERYGSLKVVTGLPAGTRITIESHTREIAFTVVQEKMVGDEGSVRFDGLLPGEYRLVAYAPDGALIVAGTSFGVGRFESTTAFDAPAPPS